MVPLFSHFSAFFRLFSPSKSLMVPYGTLMVPYGTLMVPPKQRFLNNFVGSVLSFSYEFYRCFLHFRCKRSTKKLFFCKMLRPRHQKYVFAAPTCFSLKTSCFTTFSLKKVRLNVLLLEKTTFFRPYGTLMVPLWYLYGTIRVP
jgi:hypothetical protein